MRLSITALVLAATLSATFARPLPSDFNDIERRWADGESEASIHARASIREATPAWPVVRATEEEVWFDPDAFESTTDERTMQVRGRMRSKLRKRTDAGLIATMRQFVENFWRTKGEESFSGAKRMEDEAPVLRPRTGMKYAFAS